MDGLIAFLDINGLVLELIVASALTAFRAPRKPRFALRVAACVAGMLVISQLWGMLVPATTPLLILRCMVCYALCGVALGLCLRTTAPQALFLLAEATALQHFAYRIADLARMGAGVAMGIPDPAGTVYLAVNAAYAAALVPAYAVGYLLFVRPLRGRNVDQVLRRRFLLMVIGVMLCINVFTTIVNGSGLQHSAPRTFLTFAVFDLLNCVFLLALLREIVEHESAERDTAMMRQLMNQQKAKFDSDKATIDLINVKTHDLKKRLATLGGRIPQEEIDGLTSLAGIYDATVRTGDETLDVLLPNRSLICEQHGIQFDRIIDGAKLAFMKLGDIYSLFGNAVDNAMEAVERLGDPSRRWIRMKVAERKGMVVVHIENPYAGELRFHEGLPVTVKADTRYHGFGMRSMRMVAERYGGALSARADNGVFRLNVVLPLPA